jgi:hypothetical protein
MARAGLHEAAETLPREPFWTPGKRFIHPAPRPRRRRILLQLQRSPRFARVPGAVAPREPLLHLLTRHPDWRMHRLQGARRDLEVP